MNYFINAVNHWKKAALCIVDCRQIAKTRDSSNYHNALHHVIEQIYCTEQLPVIFILLFCNYRVDNN